LIVKVEQLCRWSLQVLFFHAAVIDCGVRAADIHHIVNRTVCYKSCHFFCLASYDLVSWQVLVTWVTQNCVLYAWGQLGNSHLKFKLNCFLIQTNIRLTILLQTDSNRQKKFLLIYDPFHCDSIIHLLWDGEIKILSIALHAPAIPNFAERGKGIVLIKQIRIDENIIIAVLLIIGGIDPHRQVDMVIASILLIGGVASDDYGVPAEDVWFYPLQVVFVLWLWRLVVPRLVDEA